MKSALLPTLSAIAWLAVFSSPICALADSVNINITGRILSSACQPEVNPLTVPMGSVSRSALSGKGATASATHFILRLKNCPAEFDKVRIRFDGPVVSGSSDTLAIAAGAGAATGVGIQILDAANTVLPMQQYSADVPIKGGINSVNTLDFFSRYIAIADSVSAGSANGSATFTIWYSK